MRNVSGGLCMTETGWRAWRGLSFTYVFISCLISKTLGDIGNMNLWCLCLVVTSILSGPQTAALVQTWKLPVTVAGQPTPVIHNGVHYIAFIWSRYWWLMIQAEGEEWRGFEYKASESLWNSIAYFIEILRLTVKSNVLHVIKISLICCQLWYQFLL